MAYLSAVDGERKLRPSELCRLLNSTALGEVINERQLHRHRTRAGLRIGDACHIDLLRYVAWLVEIGSDEGHAMDMLESIKMELDANDLLRAAHATVVMPSHGRFVGASSTPFSDYRRKPGDRKGLNWRVPLVRGHRAVRHVLFDTNYWKSFVHARLAVAMGDKGCLSLFGDHSETHRLLAEHLTAEYRIKTEGRGRTVDEWKIRPERFDNHWLDCLVGCAVAASMLGSVVLQSAQRPPPQHPTPDRPKRQRVSYF